MYFNPRPRKEGDQEGDTWKHPYDIISIHALVKRATSLKKSYHPKPSISIHALVKRATRCKHGSYNFFDISIHALVKRATQGRMGVCSRGQNFNPRPRKEGDIHRFATAGETAIISIHALVKRATSEALQIFFKLAISIHALVKRATVVYMW